MTSHHPKARITAASATDVGRVRDHNEDACLIDTDSGLFIVSDGMGGRQAGELASQVVVRVLPALIQQHLATSRTTKAESIRLAMQKAILDLSRHTRAEATGRIGLHGMGATVVAVLVRGKSAHIAHMGDSRAYRLRGGRMEQLTDDHSVVGILLRGGEITPEEAAQHPARGQLSRFVGMEGDVHPDTRTIAWKIGDRLLVCSDGLTAMVPDDKIAELLLACEDPSGACRALVDAANEAGGRDNCTVIIVDFGASR